MSNGRSIATKHVEKLTLPKRSRPHYQTRAITLTNFEWARIQLIVLDRIETLTEALAVIPNGTTPEQYAKWQRDLELSKGDLKRLCGGV